MLDQCGAEYPGRHLRGGAFRAATIRATPSAYPASSFIETGGHLKYLLWHFGNHLPEIIVEPGRSMVGDAGIIESEVVLISTKDLGEQTRWVYLDVGKFSGLVETMDEAIKYRLRTPHDGGATGPVVLAGPTCDSVDILYEKTTYRLPMSLKEGDKVRILSCGAYTTTYSTVGFNGFAPLKAYFI